MKPSKPGTKRPSPDTEVNTGIKKIPCYSKLDNQTPLDYAVTFLFGGVRAWALDCGEVVKVKIDGNEYTFDGDFYYKDGKTYIKVVGNGGLVEITINKGQQDKHIPGTNNYIKGRSILTANPDELIKNYTGKGDSVRGVSG